MRVGVVASALLWLGTAHAASSGALYRLQVTNVKVSPTHAGHAWDQAHGEIYKKGGASCCHGSTMGDGAEPDLKIVIRVGQQVFSSRVAQDKVDASFDDFAYFSRSPDEPVEIEVWDEDGTDRELVGKTRLTGELPPMKVTRFGEVSELSLSAEKMTEARNRFVISGTGEDVQPTPLVLFSGEKVLITATGKMCVDKKTCSGPEGLSERAARALSPNGEGTPGTLSIQTGEGEALKAERLPVGTFVVGASGHLAFRLTTANGRQLDGAYEVSVVVNP
jgi:hypothetical protein